MANDVKNKRVNIYIDQTAATAAYDKLIAQQTKLNKTIAEGTANGKNMTASIKQLDTVTASIKKVQDQIDKGLKPSFQQQTTLVTQLRNEIKRLSESDPQFAAKLANFKKQNEELQRMQGNLQKVNESQSTFGKIFTKVAEYFTAYSIITKVTGAVSDFFKNSIEEASQSEQQLSKLKNILDNLGRSDAFDRLKNKADEMAEKFKFIDNDDVVGVFQSLITYGKLSEKQIDELTPVIIDFASKAGVSLEESTSVILKALEGNSKALKEYGINMKDGANVTERMSILMTDLKPRVDGAADAFGNTFAGKLAIAKQNLKNLEEETGNKLIPILTKLLGVLNTVLSGIDKIGNGFGGLSGANFAVNHFIDKIAKQNDDAVSSLLEGTQDKSIQDKQKLADSLGKKIVDLQNLYNKALFNSDKDQVNRLSTSILVYTNARKKLTDEIGADQGGAFNPGSDKPAPGTKTIDEAAQKLANLKKQAQDFLNQLNDDDWLAKIPNDLQAVAAAAKKYFQDIATLNKDFSGGLISLDDFNKGLAQVEAIYKDKIHDLQKDPQAKLKVEIVPELPPEEAFDFKKAYHAMGLPTPEEQQKITAENKKKQQEIIGYVTDGLNVVSQALDGIEQQQERIDQKRINNIEKGANLEKSALAAQLNGKIISQQSYQAKINEIDKRADAQKEAIERKAFARNKRLQIAQATINTAAAIAKTFGELGWPAGIAGAAIAAATLAVQIAAIAAQKFAGGGKVLSGQKITSPQNVPTQSNGDNVLAYVKRGEVVLNERQQAALGGPGVFASIGVPGFGPSYKTRPYMAIDTVGITDTYTRLRYAAGGIVGRNSTQDSFADTANIEKLLGALLVQAQNQIPVVVQNTIQLKQITDAEAQQTRIKQNATLQ